MAPAINQVISGGGMTDIAQTGHVIGISDTALICGVVFFSLILILAFLAWAWSLYVGKTCFGCKDIKNIYSQIEELENDLCTLFNKNGGRN